MEKKNKLLKEFARRLPYKVKFYYTSVETLHSIKIVQLKNDSMVFLNGGIPIEDCKPYLRPIHTLTEDEMDRMFDILHIDKEGRDDDWIKINDVTGIKFFLSSGRWIEELEEVYNYLDSIHIDYLDLISDDLAIEVTEENNPYKD